MARRIFVLAAAMIAIIVAASLIAPAKPKSWQEAPDKAAKHCDEYATGHAIVLGKHGCAFWPGPSFEHGDKLPSIQLIYELGGPASEEPIVFPCAVMPEACFDYVLQLTGAGERLRVAIDSATPSVFGIEMYGPDGEILESKRHFYSNEVFVDAPVRGEYLARVVAYDRTGTPEFIGGAPLLETRLRAMVEDVPQPPTRVQELLPNLRTHVTEPGLGECDEPLLGLEKVPDTTCLRFTTWTHNVGPGPFAVRMTQLQDADLLAARQPAQQLILSSDGSMRTRAAGMHETLIHPQHMHFHLDRMMLHELFQVVAPGELERLGEGEKVGWCPLSYRLAQWDRFYQAPVDASLPIGSDDGGNCGLDQRDPLAILQVGWQDRYGYYLDGQQVPWDGHPDGQYVVRSTADPGGNMLEIDESDNAGYVWFTIVDGDVTVHETGHGLSPWDRHKQALDPAWN